MTDVLDPNWSSELLWLGSSQVMVEYTAEEGELDVIGAVIGEGFAGAECFSEDVLKAWGAAIKELRDKEAADALESMQADQVAFGEVR